MSLHHTPHGVNLGGIQGKKGCSVRNTFLKTIWLFACLAWSGMAAAVGFGGINVSSALGQPLTAEIDLVAVDRTDKGSLSARLASPEAFKNAGIDYPYTLPKLKFRIETRANGDAYIKLTSDQPVNEPFVSILLELNWSAGRMLREYTFLLDPPGFVPEQPPAPQVRPIEPVAPVVQPPAPVAESAPVAPAAAPVVVPAVAAAPAPVPAAVQPAPVAAASDDGFDEPVTVPVATPAPVAEPAPVPVAEVAPQPVPQPVAEPAPVIAPAPKKLAPAQKPVAPAATSVTVKRGDTLGKIAAKSRPLDVSLERMLVAMYRANSEAFEGDNMNRLKTGKILRMPESEELAHLQQAEAMSEVRAHVADWNEYRQKLAAARGTVAESAPKQEARGKIATAVTEKAPASKETAKEVLKLSKGEAPGDKADAGGKAKPSTQDKANAKEEEAIAKAKALKEAQDRAAILEKNIKDMQRLVELRSQAAKSGVASAVAAPVASAVTPASAVEAPRSAVLPAAPKLEVPVAPLEEPALVDELLENPVYLGGIAAVVLGLGGLGLMYVRRKRESGQPVETAPVGEDTLSATGRIAEPVQPSPETGDFTQAAAAPVHTAFEASSDEVDPIAEADLFLNFGRDVQAEEVLKEALNKDPSNIPVKLKLLSIYAGRKDAKSFYTYANEIKQSGDAAAWEQASAMGRELEPGNPLYGGTSEVATEAAAPAEADAGEIPALDFDLGMGGTTVPQAEAAPEVVEATTDFPLDFNAVEQETPANEKTIVMSAPLAMANAVTEMDFDVTGTTMPSDTAPAVEVAATEQAPALNLDAVIDVEPEQEQAATIDFDITGTHPGLEALATEAETPATEKEAAEAAPSLNLDDLVFDVTGGGKTEEPLPEPVAEAAPAKDEGLEFSIDFPLEMTESTPKAEPAIKDIGLGEISLNLDDEVAPAAVAAPAGVRDEHWQEVATKLDLAKAYQEMGDAEGAREILEEVLREGDEQQQEAARSLLQQLA